MKQSYNAMTTVMWREYRAYFASPIAYVFLTTFVVLSMFLFFRSFFLIGQADMRPFFLLMPWVFLFFIPAIAMGKWAEERRQGTLELLLTMPISDGTVVLGKFFAGLGLIEAALLATAPLALTVGLLGDLDWGPVIGGYLGLMFLGGAYLAIGLVISSITQNQIIAFIVSVLVCFAMLVVGEPIVTIASPDSWVPVLQYLGLNFHFTSISRGVIDSRDVVYYVSVIGFFLWLNYRVIVKRR